MTLILFCNQRLPRKWSVHNRQSVAFHKCQSGTLMNPSEYKKKTLCIMEEIGKSQRLQNILKPSQNHPDKTEKNALIQIDLQQSYSSCSHHPSQIHKGDMTKHCDYFSLFFCTFYFCLKFLEKLIIKLLALYQQCIKFQWLCSMSSIIYCIYHCSYQWSLSEQINFRHKVPMNSWAMSD